jgi:hypothetical protein
MHVLARPTVGAVLLSQLGVCADPLTRQGATAFATCLGLGPLHLLAKKKMISYSISYTLSSIIISDIM